MVRYSNSLIIQFAMLFIIFGKSIHAQELVQKNNDKPKQGNYLYAGIGQSTPNISEGHIYLTGVKYFMDPIPSSGVTGQLGGTFFIFKHWGLTGEFNGNYYFNGNTSNAYGAVVKSGHCKTGHLLGGIQYSILIRKLAIDIKLKYGLAYFYSPEHTITFPGYSTGDYDQKSTHAIGRSFNFGIGLRYQISQRIGCFLSSEIYSDKVVFKNVNYVYNGVASTNYVPSQIIIGFVNTQLGIVLSLGRK